jgi:hypothetical protein
MRKSTRIADIKKFEVEQVIEDLSTYPIPEYKLRFAHYLLRRAMKRSGMKDYTRPITLEP